MKTKDLKTMLADETQLEDLMLAKDALETLVTQHKEIGITTPEWVADKLIIVRDAIAKTVQGELLRQLRAAEAREAALKSKSEQRKEASEEAAFLRKRLGLDKVA